MLQRIIKTTATSRLSCRLGHWMLYWTIESGDRFRFCGVPALSSLREAPDRAHLSSAAHRVLAKTLLILSPCPVRSRFLIPTVSRLKPPHFLDAPPPVLCAQLGHGRPAGSSQGMRAHARTHCVLVAQTSTSCVSLGLLLSVSLWTTARIVSPPVYGFADLGRLPRVGASGSEFALYSHCHTYPR